MMPAEIPTEMRDAIVAVMEEEKAADQMADLALLRDPFDSPSLLPVSTCQECEDGTCDRHERQRCNECHAYTGRHEHIAYVGHGDVTDRLLNVDPFWTWEPLGLNTWGTPAINTSDTAGGYAELWIRLTVCGVTRIEVGTAPANTRNTAKMLVSDAIRRAAMRFGVALELRLGPDDDRAPVPTSPGGQPGGFVELISETERNHLIAVFADVPDADRNRVLDEWLATLERPLGNTRTHEYLAVFDSATAAVKAHNATPAGGTKAAALAALAEYPKLTLADLKAYRDHIGATGSSMSRGKAAAVLALADALHFEPIEVVQEAADHVGREAVQS